MIQNAKAGQLNAVFSLAEISTLQKTVSNLQPSMNSGTVSRAYTNGFKTTDLIYPFIKKRVIERIQQQLGVELKLTIGMYLKEFLPWEIHTDYNKGDQHPGLAVLIPLHTDAINTHTVMFNEECTNDFTTYRAEHEKLEHNAVNLQQTLMSHESVEHLEYVSLLAAIPWSLGSVLYWDRRLLHSSDNFVANGILEKHALVMFFNND
jgi:hypothetical protein